jgi:hypothetical protein
MLRHATFTALMLILAAPAIPAQHNCGHCPAAKACPSAAVAADTSKPTEPVFQKLPGAGKRVDIGDNYYFTYRFDKTPKIGVVVLKVQVFSNIKKGARVKDFEITGLSGLASREGAGLTGGQFKLNRLGDYLLPINFSSRGEWEVRLGFKKDGKDLYYGRFSLKV